MQPWESPDLEATRLKYKSFAEKHLGGDFSRRDRAGSFLRSRWQMCADFGLLSACMPTQWGGEGQSVLHALAAFEGLGYGCHDGGFVYALCSQLFGIQMTLTRIGSEALLNSYLGALMRGELLAAHAFSEEGSGSDPASMSTQADRNGEHYVLNGAKCFVTNSPEADVALVFARTGEASNAFGFSAFLVDLTWEGVRKGREFEKVGLRTVRMGELVFEDVEVPIDHRVGGEGAGLRVLGESTAWERALLVSTALGPMKRALDACLERAKSRRQFGRPIGSFQQVSARIADMILAYRSSRMMVYDTASKLDHSTSALSFLEDCALVKLHVTEQFRQIEIDALQIFGVRGYLLESFIQQDLRDSLSFSLWAGTTETLKNTVARCHGLGEVLVDKG